MASELYVETLKGLTSGANANKVIIPSGQTLDASAGTFTPSSKQIIQTTYAESNGVNSGSGAWLDGVVTGTITPKSSSSKVVAFFSLPNNYTGVNNDILMRILVNGTDICPSLGNLTYLSVNTYINVLNSDSHRHSINVSKEYTSGSTATQTWTYKLMDTNASTYYVNYPSDRGLHTITLMEIAA